MSKIGNSVKKGTEKEFYIKHKNKFYIIGMLIFTIGIIALSSGCSQTRKIQGIRQLTGETANGTSITLPDFITTYYCFTKKNLMYIVIKSGSGLKRSEPIAYTVDGNKLIISTGEGSPLVINCYIEII